MSFSGKSKKGIIRLLSALMCLFFLANCLSCSGKSKENAVIVPEEKPEYMFIITDDTPNCSMIISDEVFQYLNNQSEYSYILDMMNDYFNVVINDEIDPNIVYIKAVTEKIDAEVRLAEIYDPTNKVSILLQIAEIGKTVLPSYVHDKEEGEDAIVNISDIMNPVDTGNELYTNVLSSMKLIASKGSVYSVQAIKNELKEKTAQIYDTPSSIIQNGNIGQLKYKDYYIDIDDENGISIVCGSQESVINALNYFLTEYVQMGTSNNGDFTIDVPDSKVHVGHYLKCTIADLPVEKYTIVYCNDKTYYDSRDNAKYLHEYILKNCGEDLPLEEFDEKQTIRYKIVVGKTPLALSDKYYSENDDIFQFRILHQGSDIYIMGGSDWAIRYALDYLIETFFSREKDIPVSFSKEGSINGVRLHPKGDDTDVRIMSNNVWNCNYNADYWYNMGENSFSMERFKKMANVYSSYEPDIISFQELHPYYTRYMIEDINQLGNNYLLADKHTAGYAVKNFTPIIFNQDTVSLLDSGSHVFSFGQNSSTKSYTWGYFEMKKTGYRFLVFSTHLWWKSDQAKEGSSNVRAMQMAEICDVANGLIEKYDCPCFVTGDMNCKVTSKEYGVFEGYNYEDCHSIAVDAASNRSGRYVCNENNFSYKPNAGTYKKNAIDHILVKNFRKASVLTYDYALPNFYGKLSDHAPVYIDVKLHDSESVS